MVPITRDRCKQHTTTRHAIYVKWSYLAKGANFLVALGPSSKAAAAVPGYVKLGIFLLIHSSYDAVI